MTRKWVVSLLGAAAMGLSAGAYAQVGFYAGLDIGRSDVGSENDTGFKFFGGYQFHRNIAAELGYGWLYDKGGLELTALEATAVGIVPLATNISIYGKLGLANLDASPGGDETEVTWAIGGQYDFTRNLGARVQWQRYETDDAIDFLSVGVVWKF